MSHSHARSLHQDTIGKFVYAKEATLKGNGTSHDPYPSYRHSPERDSDSESEGHGPPDTHATAPHRTGLSGDEPIMTGLDQTGPRVRFRSRVRISAGIGRRQRRFSDGFSSNASSISGSTSSSMSAPLRTHNTGRNGWGPLGGRIKLLASQTSPIAACQDDDANGVGVKNGHVNGSGSGDGHARRRCARSSLWMFLNDDVDEHTRLLTAATRHSYAGRYVHDSCNDDVSEREQERWWREQLVDEVFGKWPGRLLNRHWWWWHLEPIVCCLCEPEDE